MPKILAVSDIELPYLYEAIPQGTFSEIDFVISCGDLPFSYLEYILSLLNRDLFFVRGNHAPEGRGVKEEPEGARNLHMKTARSADGTLLAGIEGSLLYNYGPHQYTQAQMWGMAGILALKLLLNRLRFGRFLDILVTHAPPWKINDLQDAPHQGVKAFRWLVKTFKPRYHLHGHTIDYLSHGRMKAKLGPTTILNVSGYEVLEY